MTLVWRPGYLAEGDPYFSNVSLLLHGDGANGSTNIVDSSPTPKTVTAAGNAKISTAILDPFGQSTGVIEIGNPTTAGYLDITRIPFALNESLTLEAWLYKVARNASDYSNIFASNFPNVGETQVGYDLTTENAAFMYIAGGFGVPVTSSTPISSNAWHHLAYVRDNANCAIFVDGILEGSGTRGVGFNVERIGATNMFAYPIVGYLSNVRITKGVARYTANFTPPDAPFPDAQY